MPAWNTITVPYAQREEVLALLEELLGAGAPYRGVRPDREVITGRELRRLELSPEDHPPTTFACYERHLPTARDPVVFVEMDGRADLKLAGSLSRRLGGLVIAAESWRFVGRSALALFYAGVPVQVWARDGLPWIDLEVGLRVDSLDVDAEYRRLLGAACGLDAATIYPKTWPVEEGEVTLLRVPPRPTLLGCRDLEAVSLDLALFAFVTVDAAASVEGRDLRQGETRLGVPYVALVGPPRPDPEALLSLQRRLDTYALALSLSPGWPPRWWSAGPDWSPRSGEMAPPVGRGLLRRLQGFAVLMGAQAGELRLPG